MSDKVGPRRSIHDRVQRGMKRLATVLGLVGAIGTTLWLWTGGGRLDLSLLVGLAIGAANWLVVSMARWVLAGFMSDGD